MFTASCSYVQKLLPFPLYTQAREEAVRQVLLLKLRNQLRNSILPDQKDFYGLDRFADEHWIGSHPDIIPCDMDPFGNLSHVFLGLLDPTQFDWAMGPRHSGVCGGINDHLQGMVRNNTDLRRREILLLPGLIVKWHALYGSVSQRSSWVWTYFDDGEYWWQGVQQHGSANAVQMLTDRYRMSVDGSSIETGFALLSQTSSDENVPIHGNQSELLEGRRLNASNRFAVNLTMDETNSPRYAVFYHVAVPNKIDGTLKNEDAQIRAVRERLKMQLEIVSQSDAASLLHKPVTVFYTVAGQDNSLGSTAGNVQGTLVKACSEMPNLTCRPLFNFHRNYEGETLRQLYRFCRQYPTYRVSYIHNQSPMRLRVADDNDNLVRHLTMAATSQLCFELPSHTCNVCGLLFHTLWTFFFPGNMFAASCDYVSRLVAPEEFERKMQEYVGELLLRRLRSQLTTSLYPDQMDYFGLDRYAIEHWIGSHPSLTPCDLSSKRQDFKFWMLPNRTLIDFNRSNVVHQRGFPFGLRYVGERNMQTNSSLRRREAAYLAGHLLQWYKLYREAPAPLSWVWWNLPEGALWLKGNHDYGMDAVNKMTSKYVIDDL
jgi:hypothetical protein